ncbi:MAG: YbaY family lipoprotein [Chloroflexota bacterium]|nr:YbaY family lipoprotein [Chloroflexota bacterium]
MNPRLVIVILLILSAMLLAVAGCQGDSGSGNSTSTVTSGKRPNASVSGTVTYRERLALTPGARLEVQLRDTSLQDAAAPLIAEQVIENPGQAPIDFEVEYNRDDINDRNTYSIQARIVESDGRLAFINDTAYDVITRGNPRRVEMLLVMVQPPPPGEGEEPVDPNAWVEAEYPVVGAELLPPHEGDFLRVWYLQSETENCSRRRDQAVMVNDGDIVVSLTHMVPPAAEWRAPCDENLVELDEYIDLGGLIEPGETYTLFVNGHITGTFSRPPDDFPFPVNVQAQIVEEELQTIEGPPLRYELAVTYGIAAGSGCSHPDGFTVSRREPDVVDVTLTYYRVAPDEGSIVCITDYPVEEVVVPLGSQFTGGQEYMVRLNGEDVGSFTGR